MKSYYIIDINNEQTGPIDEENLRADFEQSFYTPETLAWTQGMPSWKPLSAIFGNSGASVPPPMPKQRGSVLIVSTDNVVGYSKGTSLGLVSANIVMSRNVAVDAVAVTKSLFGGESPQYTKLMNDAREVAIQRIKQ